MLHPVAGVGPQKTDCQLRREGRLDDVSNGARRHSTYLAKKE